MSDKDYLLLPQRHLKAFLKSRGNTEKLAADIDAQTEERIESFQQVGLFQPSKILPHVYLKPRRYRNYIDLLGKQKDSTVLNKLCDYVVVASLCALSATSKFWYAKVKTTRLAIKFKSAELARLVQKCSGNPNFLGVMRNKTIDCGREAESIDLSVAAVLSEFFADSEKANCLTAGGCRITSFSSVFDTSINDTTILKLIDSFQVAISFELVNLNLEGSAIGTKGLMQLCKIMQENSLPKLQQLNLCRNNITDIGFKRLKSILGSHFVPLMSSLKLSSNLGRYSVLDMFEILDSCPVLSTLEICHNRLDLMDGEAAPTLLRGIISMQYIITLDMSFNPLGDVGMVKFLKVICPLRRKTSLALALEELILQGAEIGNGTLTYIASMLKQMRLTKLKTLSLGMNEIGAIGVESLLEAIVTEPECAPALRSLMLPLNNIGNEGMMMFVSGVIKGGFETLEILDLTDVGANSDTINRLARTVAAFGRLPNLKRLMIFGIQPFPGKSARSILPKEFFDRVQVS